MQLQTSEMVRVPSGSFTRGSPASPDEQPVREVEMSSFLIDRTPVTNADFARFVDAGGYHQPRWWTPTGWAYVQERDLTHPTYWLDSVWNGGDLPVTGVSWWEALAFARFSGKSLPTEAQWEYACRGVDGRTYPWGDEEPTLADANFAPDCEPVDRRPTPPDAHPSNVSPFGCVDMAGNFAEWCLDNYCPGYDWEGAEGPDPLFVIREEDEHVVRGGCGLHSDDYLRSSARDYYFPGMRDNLVGLRCVSR